MRMSSALKTKAPLLVKARVNAIVLDFLREHSQ
jgi:hypothetical protein